MQSSAPHHGRLDRLGLDAGAAAGGPAGVVDLGRLLLGLTVVTVGVLFLLDAAGALNADKALAHWWPVPIVAAGLFSLADRPRSIARGSAITAVGVVALLFTTHVLRKNAWDYVWPAAVIVVGAVIIARWHGRTIPTGASADDVVRSTALFSSPNLASSSQNLHGAWLTALFGDITLDLRAARPADEGASVSATVAFGGVTLLVPRGWRISVRSMPIFGSLDDETEHSQPPADDAPVLDVDAVTIFGGVHIKHER